MLDVKPHYLGTGTGCRQGSELLRAQGLRSGRLIQGLDGISLTASSLEIRV